FVLAHGVDHLAGVFRGHADMVGDLVGLPALGGERFGHDAEGGARRHQTARQMIALRPPEARSRLPLSSTRRRFDSSESRGRTFITGTSRRRARASGEPGSAWTAASTRSRRFGALGAMAWAAALEVSRALKPGVW